jgi:hypothetical protein
MKNAILVDPKEKTVELIDLPGRPDILAALRQVISAPQISVVPIPEQGIAVFVDAMGLLKPGRFFWRFPESEYRFAGRSVVTQIDLAGVPKPLPDDVDIAQLQRNLVFDPPEMLERIDESLAIIPDEDGHMVPMIHRVVVWADRPQPIVTLEEVRFPEIEEPVLGGWSVYEREDGSYRAIEHVLRGSELIANQMVSAPNLDALRLKLPGGLTRIEPTDTDSPDLIETWISNVPAH